MKYTYFKPIGLVAVLAEIVLVKWNYTVGLLMLFAGVVLFVVGLIEHRKTSSYDMTPPVGSREKPDGKSNLLIYRDKAVSFNVIYSPDIISGDVEIMRSDDTAVKTVSLPAYYFALFTQQEFINRLFDEAQLTEELTRAAVAQAVRNNEKITALFSNGRQRFTVNNKTGDTLRETETVTNKLRHVFEKNDSLLFRDVYDEIIGDFRYDGFCGAPGIFNYVSALENVPVSEVLQQYLCTPHIRGIISPNPKKNDFPDCMLNAAHPWKYRTTYMIVTDSNLNAFDREREFLRSLCDRYLIHLIKKQDSGYYDYFEDTCFEIRKETVPGVDGGAPYDKYKFVTVKESAPESADEPELTPPKYKHKSPESLKYEYKITAKLTDYGSREFCGAGVFLEGPEKGRYFTQYFTDGYPNRFSGGGCSTLLAEELVKDGWIEERYLWWYMNGSPLGYGVTALTCEDLVYIGVDAEERIQQLTEFSAKKENEAMVLSGMALLDESVLVYFQGKIYSVEVAAHRHYLKQLTYSRALEIETRANDEETKRKALQAFCSGEMETDRVLALFESPGESKVKYWK